MGRVKVRRTDNETVTLRVVTFPSAFGFLYPILLICTLLMTATPAAQQKLDNPTLTWMQSVLDNWEAACRRDLRIPIEPLPWIIFYDENLAWHLQPEKQLIPSLETSPQALRFAGRTYPLMCVAHQGGKLLVPNREPIAVDIANLQAVTMPYDRERKPFFIVPLPSLFHRLAGPDQAGNLDELFL